MVFPGLLNHSPFNHSLSLATPGAAVVPFVLLLLLVLYLLFVAGIPSTSWSGFRLPLAGFPTTPLVGIPASNYSPKGEGKFFFTMMVAFAELERDMIVERTRAGLDAAKAQGRTGGRPTVITEDVLTVAKARKAKGESITAIAKALGLSRATLYRHIG
ncbi:recombinase family protein [Streptomyces blattellae]